MAAQASDRRALVRSYQPAYRFEALIYKLGRDLPLPRPVPARAILYGLVVWPALLLAYRLPGIRTLLDGASWVWTYVAIPLAVTMLLAVAEVQGRRFHLAMQAWSRHWLSAKHLAGGYRRIRKPGCFWRPNDIVFISDGRCGTPPDGFRLEGPGKVALRYPCEARRQGKVLTLRQTSTTPRRQPKWIGLADGATVRFTAMKEPVE
jgi:hypothetical protein